MELEMKSKYFKLFWVLFPVTKIVYGYLVYSFEISINNSFNIMSLTLLIIGIIDCLISIFLSKKIYKSSFYNGKFVKRLLLNRSNNNLQNHIYFKFNLFITLLGLTETAALFGLVQYLITGNLIVCGILFSFCIISWLFNYPSIKEIEENQ